MYAPCCADLPSNSVAAAFQTYCPAFAVQAIALLVSLSAVSSSKWHCTAAPWLGGGVGVGFQSSPRPASWLHSRSVPRGPNVLVKQARLRLGSFATHLLEGPRTCSVNQPHRTTLYSMDRCAQCAGMDACTCTSTGVHTKPPQGRSCTQQGCHILRCESSRRAIVGVLPLGL